jgi:transposase
MFHRFTLGRPLDEVTPYGSALLLSEIALVVCQQAAMEQRCTPLDPTRCSLTGDYVAERDQQALTLTHGSSQDHRPALKPAVLALRVSQDGGVPWVSKTWDGNASDSQIFQDRAKALLATLAPSPTPRSLIADRKLYSQANAAQLKPLGFLTPMPQTLQRGSQVIRQALREDPWPALDATTRSHHLALGHYGMAQRWCVLRSEAAVQRAATSLSKAPKRECDAIKTPRFPWQAKRFASPQSAQAAWAALAGSWGYPYVTSTALLEHKRYAGKGCPSAKPPIKASGGQRPAEVRPDAEALRRSTPPQGCFVLGPTIEADDLSAEEVSAADKAQSPVEGGFRFLKAPLFFVSSLFVQQPARIQGLLMVMT